MRRLWIWFVAVGVLALFVGIGARALRHGWADDGGAASLSPHITLPRGAAPPSHVLPAAPPTGLVFLGAEGSYDDGWPRQSVDRTALLALLHAGQYAELTTEVESLQTTFENDPSKERWINEAMLAFRQADDALDAPIDAWVAASPGSFAPLLARCAHLDAVGWERRGGGFVSQTSADAFAGMREAFTRATADCTRAIELRPGLVVARQRLLSMARTTGNRAVAEQQLALALASCPTCYRIRYVDLTYSTPRWGGTLAAVRASAEAAANAHPEAPHLRTLAGIAADEECQTADVDHASAALIRCDAAVSAGEEAAFYEDRARVRERLRQTSAELADLTHALELDPQNVPTLVRHVSLIAPTAPEQAIDETLTAARIDPLERGMADAVGWAIERTRGLAIGAASRNDADGVERAFSRAHELGASDENVAGWRAEIAPLAPLAQRLTDTPDDVEAFAAMDAALVPMGASQEVLAMWDAYIARHPDDARAFRERGGTHYLRREIEASLSDMRRACELGDAQACSHADAISAGARPSD